MQNYWNNSFREPKKKFFFHNIKLHSTIGFLEGNCSILFWMFLSHFSGFFPFWLWSTNPVGSPQDAHSELLFILNFLLKVNYETETIKAWAESLLINTLAKTPSSNTWRSSVVLPYGRLFQNLVYDT